MIELRCDSFMYRRGYSGKCQNLLLCYDDDLHGTLEVKCGRCKQVKRFTIAAVDDELGTVRVSSRSG